MTRNSHEQADWEWEPVISSSRAKPPSREEEERERTHRYIAETYELMMRPFYAVMNTALFMAFQFYGASQTNPYEGTIERMHQRAAAEAVVKARKNQHMQRFNKVIMDGYQRTRGT